MSLKPILLTTINFSGGSPASGIINLAPRTPSGKLLYARALLFRLVHSITGASTSDAITVLQYCGLLAQLAIKDRNGGYIGSRGPITGGFLRHLRQIVQNESLTKGDASATSANASGNNIKESLFVMPFELPRAKDAEACFPLIATMQQVDVTWAAATLFGTGNTVQASGATYLEVYAVPQERDTLDKYPKLIYHAQGISKFLGEVVSINGRALAFGLADFSAVAATTIGATDFATYDLAGFDGLSCPRQHINAGSYVQSEMGARALAAYSLPNSGAAEVIPFLTPGEGYAIDELTLEREVTMNVVVGAGAPGVADQSVYFVCVEPADDASWAGNVGKAPNVNVSTVNAQRAAAVATTMPAVHPKGIVPAGSALKPFVKQAVRADVATGKR
jgi:hypothetical protein